MIDVSVKIDEDDLQKAIEDLRHIAGGVQTAAMRAINRTVDGVQTDLVTLAREKYNVKAGTVRDRIHLEKATISKLSGRVQSTGKPIPLYEFGPKPSLPQPSKRPQITIEVLKGDRKPVGGGAFVAVMKSGHTGIFWRDIAGGKKVRRLPISERSGPRLENLYGKELEPGGKLQESANERMMKNFTHNVDYLFRKNNGMV